MITKGMVSSNTYEWATPQKFFDELDAEFHFTLDPCANAENHKCEKYFTISDNGLAQPWEGEMVFCNPPYGRQLARWVAKASLEGQKKDTGVVMLIPARTDTRWFHDHVYGKAEIRFLKGRLYFGDGGGRAPFPSMLVIWGKDD